MNSTYNTWNKYILTRLMNVTSYHLCAPHPSGVSEVFPLRAPRYKRVSMQSTPRAKPGPWKWDLWGSQLITAPIEVSPTFYTGKSLRVPTPWGILRSEGPWKALHECLRRRHLHSLQPGHMAKDAPTGPLIRGYQRARDTVRHILGLNATKSVPYFTGFLL